MILLDGAKFHTGLEIRGYMRKMELSVIWSAPYSYDTAPIEMVFGHLKFGDINKEEFLTGKKVSIRF